MLFNLNRDPSFKGWTKPGPIVGANVEVPDEESLDAISGFYRIFQLKQGHRFSTDDLLTAWYGTTWCPRAARVLDLGSGLGSVGMIAAWRLPGAQFVTVEAQEDSVRLARKSAVFNELTERYEIRIGDFRDQQVLAQTEKFDLVLGSPPYFPLGTGVESDHPQKIACRFEVRGNIADYCFTASRQLAPGGLFVGVFPVEPLQNARVIAGAESAGLMIVRRRVVVFREGEPPLLSLFAMMRRTDLPESMRGKTWDEPPLTIRTRTGEVHPEYSAIKLAIGFPP